MTKEERERTIREKVLGNAPADMTREEAIARIQEHMIAHKMKEPRAILISKALDMAVNALKQEPCEDAINRKELVEWLENIQPMDGKELGVLFDIREHVKKMQPVTPTREHGEWIDIVDGISYTWATCNKCNGRASMAYKYYKFCPNCGADMRKERSR